MNWKKVAIWVGIALAVFYVVTQPTSAASAVNSVIGWVMSAVDSLFTFVGSLGET